MVTLSPGPDTFLVLRYSLVRQLHGVIAALGMMVAIFAWATLAGAGAASVIQRFPIVETVISTLGGLYLIYLGLSGFSNHERSLKPTALSLAPKPVPPPRGRFTRWAKLLPPACSRLRSIRSWAYCF
ncbi:LysE family translocator [Glutamicibacter sp. M10]|uniref:LysE family translocator n=1 Tax=Glutamicibacter sp. M10 TaxID=3023076 RepID=UPI0037C0F8FA